MIWKTRTRTLALLLALCSLAALPAAALPTAIQEEATPTANELFDQGMEAFYADDPATAAERFSEALELEPGHEMALHERALAYQVLGEHDRCIADAERGLKLQSTRLRAGFHQIVGTCHSLAGRTKRALKAYRRGIEEYPEEPMLHFNIAVTLSQSGKREAARTHLKEALAAWPDHPSSNLALGQLYEADGFRIPAVLQYLRFLAIEPDSPRSALAASRALELLNAPVERQSEKEVTIFLDPDEPTSEGDFGVLSTLFALMAAVETEETEAATEAERAAGLVSRALGLMGEVDQAKTTDSFVWRHAATFLLALDAAGHGEAFGHLALQSLGIDGADEWGVEHAAQMEALAGWLDENVVRGPEPVVVH